MAASKSAKAQNGCRDHPDAQLIEDFHAGDEICSVCGLVVGDRVIDVGSEWRTFANDKDSKDMCRVGDSENPLLNGGELTTSIQYGSGITSHAGFDSAGAKLYKNKNKLSNSDRYLTTAFSNIGTMAERLNLPRMIVDKANVIFKQVYDIKNFRGRNSEAIAAACIYIACRQEKVPRTFKEIVAVCKTRKRDIGRVFTQILRVLETSVSTITSSDFMIRFCSNLGLPQTVQCAATHIAKKAVDMSLASGKSPISVAAAAIFMASQASATKKSMLEIGEIVGTAEGTIKQAYKLLAPEAIQLFPTDFQFVTPINELPMY